MFRRIAVAMLVVAAIGGLKVTSVLAEGGADCPPPNVINPNTGLCQIVAEDPGDPVPDEDPGDDGGGDNDGEGGGGDGGTPQCVTRVGAPIVCYDPRYGWWENETSCYYQAESPQPPGTDPVWLGHFPDGAIYTFTCFPRRNMHQNRCLDIGGSNDDCRIWRRDPPPTAPDPREMARRAVEEMVLKAPDIGMAPPSGSKGLVGMEVWFWNSINDHTWGPIERTVSAGAVTVTATANVATIDWDLGNGDSIECDAGTPYRRGVESDCSYEYEQPSEGYDITATSHWVVEWTSNVGINGEIELDLQSNAQIAITEAKQVLGER